MLSKTALMLMAGSSLVAGVAAAPAEAATTSVYGGGSSLIAPYLRQAGDCFSVNAQLIFRGTPPTVTDVAPFFYAGNPPQDCSKSAQDYTKNKQLVYISTGSGTGIKAHFSHDPSQYGDTDPADGTQLFAYVSYNMSDTALGAAEVGIYNNGGTNSVVGVTVAAPGQQPGPGQYPNPLENYGALVQFPVLVAPVAIVFDPVYKKVRQGDGSIKEYTFNINKLRDGGGLRLDTASMCKIFNGEITNWNDPALRKLNGNKSLQDPQDSGTFDVSMQIVGREDSSGTTSIFSRYVARACSGFNGNSYANSHSRLPGTYVDSTGLTQTTEVAPGGTDLAGVVYNKANPNDAPAGEQLGVYTLANGNDGVAKYINFSAEPGNDTGDSVEQGRIGYAGPDYALPAVLNTGANNYDLFTADVQNASGNFEAPTGVNAQTAYADFLPPETDSKGAYKANASCSTSTPNGKCRKNPQDWVEPADKSSLLANPLAKSAYPIVGTTNFLGYTCYSSADVTKTLVSFFNFYVSSKTVTDTSLGLIANAGFAPLPSAFRKAITNTFVTNKDGLGLSLSTSGAGSQCPSSVPGA